MHQSFVATASPHVWGWAGDSGANMWGSDLLSSPTVPGKCLACDITQKYGIYCYKEQGYDSQFPQGRAFSRAVMDEKLLSPLFVVGEGGSGYKDWAYSCKEPFHAIVLEEKAFSAVLTQVINEPYHEKTCLWGFQPGKTQTSLLNYRD